jgi:hypothetical protein
MLEVVFAGTGSNQVVPIDQRRGVIVTVLYRRRLRTDLATRDIEAFALAIRRSLST